MKPRLLRLGVTGGMGAGKSTVTGFLKEAGLPVINSDEVAREILEKHPEVMDYIKSEYGREVLLADGSLDRKAFGRKIFADEAALSRYEAVIMPHILSDIQETFLILEAQEIPLAVLEAPILFEVAKDLVDVAITVEILPDLQIQRIMDRDGLSRQEVTDRLKRQMTWQQRVELADYVIWNDGNLEDLKQATLGVLASIRGAYE